MPITQTQRTELVQLAASKNSPEGLKEVLAGIDENQRKTACRQQVADIATDMRMMGMVDNAALAAGRMAGRGGQTAAKMLAVAHARTIRARVSQFHGC